MSYINLTHVDEEIDRRIEEYLDLHFQNILENEDNEGYARYKIDFIIHRDRVKLCIEYIYELIQSEKPENLLVVGDLTNIDYCLREIGAYDGVKVVTTNCELREHFPFSEKTFDLIVNLEVFEHLKDKNNSQRDLFMFTGVYNLVGECYRVLKPGGKMLLSTPNACSLKAVCRVLLHKHPYFYDRHVREYTPAELKYILEVCKFEVERLETFDVWSYMNGNLSFIDVNWAENKEIMEEMLNNSKFSKELRGDDIFVLATRKH